MPVRFPLCALLLLVPLGLAAQSGEQGAAAAALDREQGRVTSEYLWRQALGGVVIGLPAVQAQSVVVALDGGNIKAYSTSGRPLWTYSARGRLSPFVTRSLEGTCYIARITGVFIAVNRAGRELWRLNLGGTLSAPAISGWDARVFIPAGKKIICCTAAGTILWTKTFEAAISASPRLDQNGGILLGLENGAVLRIDPFGAVIRRQLAAAPHSLLSIGARASPQANILAVHTTGELELIFPLEPDKPPLKLGKIPGVPLAGVSKGNRAAITMTNGQVLLISGEDGSTIWTGESHLALSGQVKETEAAMRYDERGVYVLTPKGATGFSETGRRLWFTTLRNGEGLPAFGDDGVLYSGGSDWILYAWGIEDRTGDTRPQSLYGPEPEGSYGTGSPPPSPWAQYPPPYDEAEIRSRFETIRRAIQAGEVGENELAWAAYLMEMAAGENIRPGVSAAHPPVQIRQRIMALQLLSRIGSRETVPWLARMFRRPGDPLFRAAAAEAIGGIGIDSNGVAIRSFLDAVSRSSLQDEQTLFAVAKATGALCRFSGPPLSETGVRILTILSGEGQPAAVQRQALREMDSLNR
jgi:outer membrane protein assembly factor BamB